MKWIAAAIVILALSVIVSAYKPFHHRPSPPDPPGGYWGP